MQAYYWIIASTHCLKSLYHIVLPNLHSKAWTTNNLVNHLLELWQHSLVQLKEFLSSCPVQEECLHSTNFEPFFKDSVNNLASITSLHGMWLNQEQRTVIQDRLLAGFVLIIEENIYFRFVTGFILRGMDGILNWILTVDSPDCHLIRLLSMTGIGCSNQLFHSLYRIFTNHLHANYNI